MDYPEARAFLARIEAGGNRLGLESTRILLRELGDPQDKLRFLHIAGTNGKGSVMSFLETMLIHAGYHTGRYLSPAVFSYEEKFRTDGKPITKSELVKYTGQLQDAYSRIERKQLLLPTIFEAETALSFLYFLDCGCDVVLLETGMGGADDATNIVQTTDLALFSSISMDHVEYLGDTIEKIARVKAGILKKGVPAVSDRQPEQAEEVLRRCCEKNGSELTFVHPEQIHLSAADPDGQTFSYKNHSRLHMRLLGTFQLRNAALALEGVDVLRKNGYHIPEEAVHSGIEETVWEGRFQVLQRGKQDTPWIIIDGAHNPDAARRLMDSLLTFFPGRNYYYIFGIFADKDYPEVIRITAPSASHIFTVQTPGNRRALPSGKLCEAIRSFLSRNNLPDCVTDAHSIRRALALACEMAKEDEVIIVFGSLSFLGSARDAINR